MTTPGRTSVGRIAAHVAAACALALALWLVFGGTAFVNYDSAWSLNWMRDIAVHGTRPDLERRFSPTPHPLSDLLSAVLAPLSDAGPSRGAVGHGAETVLVVSALLWLGALGTVTFALGRAWFGVGAGVVAAVIVLTREPVLSYGLRTYLDLPYAVFLLLALLAETRRPRNGLRTIAWITLAGLLRPEAWLLAAAYVGYLAIAQWRGVPTPASPDPATATPNPATAPATQSPTRATSGPAPALARPAPAAPGPAPSTPPPAGPRRRVDVRALAPLVLVALLAPLGWLVEGVVLSGDALQALTGTQQNAADLDRVTGVGSAITVMPRRLGEIVREPVLLAALGGVVLSLLLLRRRAILGVAAGIAAGAAFFLLAAAGLPLLTRYLVFPGTLLILFAAGGLLGWRRLDAGHPWRRPWQAFAVVCVVAFAAFLPGQVHRLDRLHAALGLQQRVIDDLRTATGDVVRPALAAGPCERGGQGAGVALPNHRAVPQVLLWLGARTDAGDWSTAVAPLTPGSRPAVTLLPSSARVARGFILDPADQNGGVLPRPPAGSVLATTVGSWRIYGAGAACAADLRARAERSRVAG